MVSSVVSYVWSLLLISIRTSLNSSYQSDVPEPFTDNLLISTVDNLQTNNSLTSVEGQVLLSWLFYLLNAWGKVVDFCFKMNCFCKLMLQFVHVEFLVSSERVKNFAPADGQPAGSQSWSQNRLHIGLKCQCRVCFAYE